MGQHAYGIAARLCALREATHVHLGTADMVREELVHQVEDLHDDAPSQSGRRGGQARE
jgi:hypothetical protein